MLRFGASVDELHSAFRFDFRFGLTLERAWTRHIRRHVVRIEQARPLFYGRLRSNAYRVLVDDDVVIETSRY